MDEPFLFCVIFLILVWTARIYCKLSDKLLRERHRGDFYATRWTEACRQLNELQRAPRDLALPPGRSKYEQSA